jgi:hypothetical protein
MPEGGKTGALALLAMAEVVQVMSGFLPSPTTAYLGGADERRIASLRKDEVLGSLVALGIAGTIAYIEGQWWIFFGSAAILGVFLVRYEQAIGQAVQEAADGQTPARPGWF